MTEAEQEADLREEIAQFVLDNDGDHSGVEEWARTRGYCAQDIRANGFTVIKIQGERALKAVVQY